MAEELPPLVDVKLLGEYDAMVIMRSKTEELAFVMRNDMPKEAFAECCQRLRELTMEKPNE
jgi:hypothetical protein